MTRLTPAMANALHQARTGELRRTHDDQPGQPPWPAPWQTLHALVRHDLLTQDRRRNRKGRWMDVWTITPNGRQALEPKTKTRSHRHRYLQSEVWRGGDYTSIPTRSIDTEPGMGALPVLDPDDLHPQHRAAANRKRDEARGKQDPPPTRSLRRAA